MNKNDRIYIAGHQGMVGSAILRGLEREGYNSLVTVPREELDLTCAESVEDFFAQKKPDYVFLTAAKVGGIQANIDQPVEFLRENLMIQNNVIDQCYKHKVKKLLFLGSSCIYPRECPQPMKEEYLMTGPLEPTNEGYALAKIAGVRLVQYYNFQYGLKSICPVSCNLYGPNDSFDFDKSHVLSALVRRFVDAIDEENYEVALWGSGAARREFMHVDDLVRALFFLMEKWDSAEIINVGWGTDVSIKELATLIAEKTNYPGKIIWDTSRPDGMPRKCLDVSKLRALGFRPTISLQDGIEAVIKEYRSLKYKRG